MNLSQRFIIIYLSAQCMSLNDNRLVTASTLKYMVSCGQQQLECWWQYRHIATSIIVAISKRVSADANIAYTLPVLFCCELFSCTHQNFTDVTYSKKQSFHM